MLFLNILHLHVREMKFMDSETEKRSSEVALIIFSWVFLHMCFVLTFCGAS